jgi:23S rRNA (guanosine2251-2'-O)-methyltransferase
MAKPFGDANNQPNELRMPPTVILYGIAPIQQCLQQRRRACRKLLIKENSASPRLTEIRALAIEQGLQVAETSTHQLATLTGSTAHQGVALFCGPLPTPELGDFLTSISEQPTILLIALDQVEDPQNVGAIIRSAAFLGADGLLMLKRHAAPLSPAVSKASAGALESFPIVLINNLAQCLTTLQKQGFNVIGAGSGDGAVDYRTVPQASFTVLVLGNEGQGLRELTRKRCDFLARIPGKETVESLNVSAAAAILIQHLAGTDHRLP